MKTSKLALTVLITTTVVLIFCIQSFVADELSIIENSVLTIQTENVKQLSNVVEAQENINKVPWLISRIIFSENQEKRTYLREQILGQIEIIERDYINKIHYREDEQVLHDYVRKNWTGYKETVFEIIKPSRSTNIYEDQDRMEDSLLYLERVNNGLKMIVALHERDVADKTNETLNMAVQAKHNVLGLAIVASITFVFVGVVAFRKVIYTEDRLRIQAYHDVLTGLPNRLSFQKSVSNELRNANGSTGGAVVFLDLDNFKFINDQYGHDIGDQFLINIANRIRSLFSENVFGARFGGDEFVLYLRNVDEQSARFLINKLLMVIGEPIQVAGITISPTPSIGVAFYPEHGRSAVELLKHADIAMYKAKVKKNSYVIYDASAL